MSDTTAIQAPLIVVGVDGSEPSKAALRWAVWQAELTGYALVAAIAWDFPHNWTGWSPPGEPSFDWEDSARDILAATIDEALGTDQVIEIRTRVVQGHPAGVLLDEANGAGLLVVGNRGHGGFSEALLGSVGQHLTHHATCPIVVVRDPQTR
ncbi:universal stress protein [Streptacidiphilus neutrinimicus]|uniref:universal stress protein n=1 Tax=Streptacidiphilus neutrinimicus TaxID=105420 RepID=UPI0005A93D83|nr:universal stress protein [Streptacidiphilus neutrinimicus]